LDPELPWLQLILFVLSVPVLLLFLSLLKLLLILSGQFLLQILLHLSILSYPLDHLPHLLQKLQSTL
jgi:hypothetical protein